MSPSSGPPRGTLLFIHGLGDHPGRLIATARTFAARGFRTILLELIAHGGHAVERGATQWVYDVYAAQDDAGELARLFRADPRTGSAEMRALRRLQYVALGAADSSQHLAQVSRVVGDVLATGARTPFFIGGHSMGGLLAIETVRRCDAKIRTAIRGVVLAAPALEPQGAPNYPLTAFALDVLWRLRGTPFAFVRSAARAVLKLPFSIDTSAANIWVSDQPAEVSLYDADPLLPHRFPTRYVSSIETLMADAAARSEPFPLEALVLVPGRDGITSRAAAVAFADRTNGVAGRKQIAVVEFPVTAHDLFRSSVRQGACTALGDWLDAHLSRTADPSPAMSVY